MSISKSSLPTEVKTAQSSPALSNAERIKAASAAGRPVLADQHRPTQWSPNSLRGYVVATKDVQIATVDNGVVNVETIMVGTRIVIGRDCTSEQADIWLAAGKVKPLPCVTVRILVSGWPWGITNPADRLKRSDLECIEGGGDERIIQQGIETGVIEYICDGPYKGDPASLQATPLPFKSVRKQRMREQVVGYGGIEPPRMETYYEQTGEFATGQPIFGTPRGFSSETRPLVRVKANVTDVVGGLPLTAGVAFDVSVLWALKVCEDPALRLKKPTPRLDAPVSYTWLSGVSEGDPPVSITGDIPPVYEAYRLELATYMACHPGTRSDAADFPAWPVEAA